MMKKPDKIEILAELVHKAYCQYCKEVKGKEYWTKGDYSKLDEETKEADRYTVRSVLKGIERFMPSEEEIKEIILKWAKEQEAIDKFGEITLVETEQGDITAIAKAIHKRLHGSKI